MDSVRGDSVRFPISSQRNKRRKAIIQAAMFDREMPNCGLHFELTKLRLLWTVPFLSVHFLTESESSTTEQFLQSLQRNQLNGIEQTKWHVAV